MSAADRFRAAVRDHDVPRAAQEFAEDIAMYNPFAVEPLTGRDAVAGALKGLSAGFDEFDNVRVLTSAGDAGDEIAETQAVMFRAKIGDQVIEGLDVLEVSQQDQIVRFTVYARPLPALQALGRVMAERSGRN